MGYTHPFLDVRHIDADTVAIYLNGTSCLIIDNNATPAIMLRGGITTAGTGSLKIFGCSDGNFPFLYLGSDLTQLATFDTDLYLNAQGTGSLRFGTYTGGAATDSTGYITIKDIAGNTRKLMVQA